MAELGRLTRVSNLDILISCIIADTVQSMGIQTANN